MARVKVPANLREALVETRRVMGDPLLLLWSLYIFLFPMYVFQSGLPQPGDLLIVVLLPVAVSGWRGNLYRPSARALRGLGLFLAWVVLVDVTYAVVLGKFALLGNDGFLMAPVYFLYNAAVFLVCLILYQRYGERALWLTLHMVLITALTQVFISFVYHTQHGGRGIVLFNNPNQLGFYALLSASILALGRRRLGFGAVKTAIGFTACTYLALLSASKAALGGTAILFFVSLLSNPRAIIALTLVAGGLLFAGGPVDDAITKAQQRFDKEDQNPEYSFFEARGYDRITNHKEYWLLGAGEGGLSRFKGESVMSNHELHSSGGTLFFCYGIVGCVLFLGFVFRVLEGGQLRMILMLMPTLAYSIAHQGLRFTMFWMLMATFVAIKHHIQLTVRAAPAPRRLGSFQGAHR